MALEASPRSFMEPTGSWKLHADVWSLLQGEGPQLSLDS